MATRKLKSHPNEDPKVLKTIEDVMLNIRIKRKPPTKPSKAVLKKVEQALADPLIKKKFLREIIDDQIRKESRFEAMNVMMNAGEKDLTDFFKHHEEDNGNIVCLVVDFVKMNLVKAGKMKQRKKDDFGKPF